MIVDPCARTAGWSDAVAARRITDGISDCVLARGITPYVGVRPIAGSVLVVTRATTGIEAVRIGVRPIASAASSCDGARASTAARIPGELPERAITGIDPVCVGVRPTGGVSTVRPMIGVTSGRVPAGARPTMGCVIARGSGGGTLLGRMIDGIGPVVRTVAARVERGRIGGGCSSFAMTTVRTCTE